MEKTYYPKAGEVRHEWYVADASGQNLGRLAARIAHMLMGKHKPAFTPGVDTGDFVIVVNAGKITVTGNKLTEKMYYRHSMYPGGFRAVSLRAQLATHPERVITAAVRGMLPNNKLSRQLIKKLKVYAGPEHPHQAQEPKAME